MGGASAWCDDEAAASSRDSCLRKRSVAATDGVESLRFAGVADSLSGSGGVSKRGRVAGGSSISGRWRSALAAMAAGAMGTGGGAAGGSDCIGSSAGGSAGAIPAAAR